MAANVSLVAFGPVREVAVMVIIGVEALTVDGTGGRDDRKSTVLQVLLVEQATPLELADDGVTRGKGRVDVDQTREAARVGQ